MTEAGIYARISVKHGNHKDDSIKNQLLVGRSWLKEQQQSGHKIEEYSCYVDKGYSGTDFCRPAFQKMLEDAKAGKIQCIVCKDASRLGRNYLETGEYMERIFPLLGIRLVCISEGYDSGRDIPGGLGINIRNLMYQWYAQDIGRKVRMVKEEKKQRGEYLGSRAPYGFCICLREGKRVLGPDIPARKIAEEIFLWHREGLKPRQIQEKLKRQGVNPPGIYQKTGCIYGKKGEVKCWNPSTIRHVISWYRKEW